METSWKIKLVGEVNSRLLLEKADIISTQITNSCLLYGKNIIKFPNKLIGILNVSEFERDYDVIFENEIDNILIYRSDIFKLKHFIQKKDGEIIGAGVKFNDELFTGEEFIETRRMCGEIILGDEKE